MNKKVITLIIFLTTITAFSQTSTTNLPPKKTWKILIKNSNDKDLNYKLIGQTLVDNDYSIEKKDSDFLTLETSPRVTDGKMSSYFLKFIAKDNLIVLTGMARSRINVNLGNIDEEFMKITNIGMKGSISKDQFNSMLKSSKLFTECEYEYIND